MTTVIAQDLWRSQRYALDDLAAFLDEHAPGTEHPLPLLHWYIGPSHTVHAQIHALDREHGGGNRDPRAVITAYSDALDTSVEEHPDEDSMVLVAHGRIGPPQSTGEPGRTHVVISTKVPTQTHRKVGGSAFMP